MYLKVLMVVSHRFIVVFGVDGLVPKVSVQAVQYALCAASMAFCMAAAASALVMALVTVLIIRRHANARAALSFDDGFCSMAFNFCVYGFSGGFTSISCGNV